MVKKDCVLRGGGTQSFLTMRAGTVAIFMVGRLMTICPICRPR
jgi:hypothetical protein